MGRDSNPFTVFSSNNGTHIASPPLRKKVKKLIKKCSMDYTHDVKPSHINTAKTKMPNLISRPVERQRYTRAEMIPSCARKTGTKLNNGPQKSESYSKIPPQGMKDEDVISYEDQEGDEQVLLNIFPDDKTFPSDEQEAVI